MKRHLPITCLHVFAGCAAELAQRAVNELNLTHGSGHPQHGWATVGKGTESLLTFTQRLFSLLALGGVLHVTYETEGLAIVFTDQRDIQSYPDRVPVSMNVSRFL